MSSTNLASSKLDEITLLIPGYDPRISAGDCWFDYESAQRAIDFFEQVITHVKGSLAGTPLFLEPWQKSIIANIFGWKRPDSTRRYREVFIFVPRKNGKTTMLGALLLWVLCCDGEAGAEIYSAAADRDQASLVYQQAKGMVLAEPELDSRLQIMKTSKTIVYEAANSFYRAISAEADTKHGFNAHCVVIDELHAQPNRELVDVLMTSTGSRLQPIVVHITTSDYERESICNEKHEYASKVRDGIIEDRYFLPVIYEASLDDDWTSPEVWRKANPNLNVSVSEEYLERECKRAKDSPAYENTFKRLHLNLRTEQRIRWLSMDRWSKCGADEVRPDGISEPCYAGLDLASHEDITALSMVFPLPDNRFGVVSRYWVPHDKAVERAKSNVPYLQWIREGWMTATDGEVMDYDVVRRDINSLSERFNIAQIACDRWNSVHLMTQLQNDGFDMEAFGQGYRSMSGPSKELHKIIVSQKLCHYGDPVLRWMASNVCLEHDAASNIKPSKGRSSEKIDGIITTIMGLSLALDASVEKESIYESRGILNFDD